MNIEIELARASFVIGLVVTAFAYERFRILTGGAITGTYLAYCISLGYWTDVVSFAVLSAAGYLLLKVLTQLLPLPRNWLFYIALLVPALFHMLGVYLTWLPGLDQTSAFLAAGMYITNGLTAYDMYRQGVAKTSVILAGVIAVALLFETPMRIAFGAGGADNNGMLFVQQAPSTVMLCLLAAIAVRLGLGLGSAGIIGVVFLIEISDPISLATILAFTIGGTYVYRWVAKWMWLTPRQQLHSILIVGGIVAWFGLFWAQFFGDAGAIALNKYALEPLIVVGLMLLEGVRMGLPKALGGTAIVAAITMTGMWLEQQAIGWYIGGLVALVLISLLMLLPGWLQLRRNMAEALELGKRFVLAPPIH